MQSAPGSPAMTSEQQARRDTGRLVKQVMRGIHARLDEALSVSGTTMAQVRLLAELRERPGATGAQLARALAVSPQNVQTLTARALASGWLRRGKHEENSRLVTLHLTPDGTELLAEADLIARALEAELWAGISPAELASMHEVLERCLRNLAR